MHMLQRIESLRSLRKSLIARASNGDDGGISQLDRLRSFINRMSNDSSRRPPVNTPPKKQNAYKRSRGVSGLPEQDWGSSSDMDWDPMDGLSSEYVPVAPHAISPMPSSTMQMRRFKEFPMKLRTTLGE